MADSKTLGQLLYESLADPFSFKGGWNPRRKPMTCDQYEQAAKAFAKALREREEAAHG
jgi:hypothetical protein